MSVVFCVDNLITQLSESHGDRVKGLKDQTKRNWVVFDNSAEFANWMCQLPEYKHGAG